MNLSVRIYGDSISMPRCIDGIMPWESWPAKLQEKLGCNYCVLNRSIGYGDITKVSRLFKSDKFYFSGNVGLVVFRVGIVDCAPRPIPLWLRNFIGFLPEIARNKIANFIHNHRTSMLRHMSFVITSASRFRRKYREMVDDVVRNGGQVVCVGIGPISVEMSKRCVGIDDSIMKYNAIIKEIADSAGGVFVDSYKIFSNRDFAQLLLDDGHHNSSYGNEVFADEMARTIRNITNE